MDNRGARKEAGSPFWTLSLCPGVKHGCRDNQRYILETELIGLVQGLDVSGETERRIKGGSWITCLKQLGREWAK